MPNAAADHADGLLREFFHRELPDPWPPLGLPVTEERPKPLQRRALRRSHLALAASIVILLAGLGLASELLRGGPVVPKALPAEAKKPGTTIQHKPPATTPDKSVAPNRDEEAKPFHSPLSRLPR